MHEYRLIESLHPGGGGSTENLESLSEIFNAGAIIIGRVLFSQGILSWLHSKFTQRNSISFYLESLKSQFLKTKCRGLVRAHETSLNGIVLEPHTESRNSNFLARNKTLRIFTTVASSPPRHEAPLSPCFLFNRKSSLEAYGMEHLKTRRRVRPPW